MKNPSHLTLLFSETLIPSSDKQITMAGDQKFLPFEIIINILKFLPIKSIVRFQCVCKEWKNLFKTPSFIAQNLRHRHSVHSNPCLLLQEFNYEDKRSRLRLLDHNMETLEVIIPPFSRSCRIMGSCNGLLCMQIDDDQTLPPSLLWLWNPVTGEAREVPNKLKVIRRFWSVGFGFSSVVNDYKIVRFYRKERGHVVNGSHTELDRVEVYSLRTGSWKELGFRALQGILPLSLFEALSRAVCADGTIFWLASHCVISFDIATEVFTLIRLPIEDGIYPLGLGVFENKLAVQYVFTVSRFVCIWVMEEVDSLAGKSLICRQKYNIQNLPHVSDTMCIWRNEIVCIDQKFITDVEGELKCILYLWNLINDEERKLICSTFCDWCEVFDYEIEKSMVSVWNTQQVE